MPMSRQSRLLNAIAANLLKASFQPFIQHTHTYACTRTHFSSVYLAHFSVQSPLSILCLYSRPGNFLFLQQLRPLHFFAALNTSRHGGGREKYSPVTSYSLGSRVEIQVDSPLYQPSTTTLYPLSLSLSLSLSISRSLFPPQLLDSIFLRIILPYFTCTRTFLVSIKEKKGKTSSLFPFFSRAFVFRLSCTIRYITSSSIWIFFHFIFFFLSL